MASISRSSNATVIGSPQRLARSRLQPGPHETGSRYPHSASGGTPFVTRDKLDIVFSDRHSAGVYAALKPYSRVDYAVNLFAFAGIFVLPFWLAWLLILIFAVTLGWLPAGGMQTLGKDSIVDRLQYLVLPVLTLTIGSVGGFTRFMRASMLETLPGLRQNGTRKRVERSPRGYGSRTPKCINTARDRRRLQFRRTVFRRIDYRDNVWLARHGENYLRCNYGQRF